MNTPSIHALPAGSLAPEDVGTVRNLAEALPPDVNLERAGLFDEIGQSDPVTAERLRRAMHQLPVVGDWFAGFELIAVLGRGAFGRVYLARQGDLADRYVALKVSTDLAGESRTLARLQHTNIVPIYSVHRVAPFQAVCMPYFGATTLGHLLARYRGLRSLPASGRQLVDTLCGLNDQTDAPSAVSGGSVRSASSSHRGIGTGGHSDRAEPSGDAGTLPPRSGTQGFLGTLRKMSYSEAVCWIGARLAEGLAHAHSQGLIHNDLKPANVLLTDDGRPMLLDFGVAEDLAVRASAPIARIGGTLPFMAPEHLDSIESGTPATDHRSDIYGLGILLFEMLTGQHPFRFPTGKTEEEVPRMLAERRAGAPRIRPLNRTVTPGLEAIVRKCLEPDPARRYQSAAAVCEDLDRHRTDQPLLHVRVPSIRERLAKWSRRHPRLTSNLSLGIAAVMIIGLCVAGLSARGSRIERYEAAEVSRGLDDDLKTVRFRLSARPSESQAVGVSIDRCESALGRYGLPEDTAWDRRPTFHVLPADEQERVRARLTEACLLLARGYALRARGGEGEAELLGHAVELNALAERVAGNDVPRAVWEQRAGLFRRQGKPEDAERAAARAKETPLQTGRDYYLSGAEALVAGRLREARELLAKSVELNPADFWAHAALGASNEALGNYPAAVPCYDTAIALQPDVSWGYFNRGLLALRMKDYEKARKSLNRAAELDPDHPETYFQRAIAFQWLHDYDSALKDLDRAVEAGGPKARAAYMRVRVRELSGDRATAKRELDEALKLEPTDELSWQSRGAARANIDLAGALKDFDAALALNPRSMVVLQNRSAILGRLGRDDEALRALDKVLELYPDFVAARADRGVMRARLGNWDGAKADAEDALRRDQSPRNLFQVGAIYALLTKHDPANKTEAIRLVAAALRGGFGYEEIATDTDLALLRGTPEFQRIVDGVRSITASAKQ
jgi:eukaryotic-like serine/threonine-protein kinase